MEPTGCIPHHLSQAYEDVCNQEQNSLLPDDAARFQSEGHFHVLDRACIQAIRRLEEDLNADFENAADPNATQFLRQCLKSTKELQAWNIDVFNAS